MSDLSTMGVRLERVFDPKNAKPIVQLEIELPGIDEVVWASAAVTHAFLTPIGRTHDGQPRFWCCATTSSRRSAPSAASPTAATTQMSSAAA